MKSWNSVGRSKGATPTSVHWEQEGIISARDRGRGAEGRTRDNLRSAKVVDITSLDEGMDGSNCYQRLV